MEYTNEQIAKIAEVYATLVETKNVLEQTRDRKVDSPDEFCQLLFNESNKIIDKIIPTYLRVVPEEIRNLLFVKTSDLENILKQIAETVPK